MQESNSSRRSFLRRGLLVLGGALGFGMANRDEAQAVAPAAGAGAAGAPTAMQLSGNHWHLSSLDRRKGELLGHGDRFAIYGELLDAPAGNKIGEFYASGFHMAAPFGMGPVAATRIELHTFSPPGGTIMGMGLAAAGAGAESAYTVLGGTGKYAGVRGTYTACQRPQELGEDGTADFTLQLNA